MTRTLDWLERILMFGLVLVLVLMVVFIGSQVFTRYVFGQPLDWTEEVSRHLMIWLVFVGGALVYRRGAHISIDLLPNRLPPAGRALVQLLAAIILGYFFYLMTVHGWQLVERTMNQRSSALRYPMGYAYAALPVSGAMMFVFNLEYIARVVRVWRTGEALGEAQEGG